VWSAIPCLIKWRIQVILCLSVVVFCHHCIMQLITSNVSELEQMLPQVAYGNLMAENLAALTPAHFRQLLLLGQACLDYLHAICCATSTVLVSCDHLK